MKLEVCKDEGNHKRKSLWPTTMTFNAIKIDIPNLDDRLIPVDYLVLHYTAVDLKKTLDIFRGSELGVSVHLVIDTDGTTYELVKCMEGRAHRACHVGVSRWNGINELNDCSIGIELVNYNGNLFPFTDEQYQSLHKVVEILKKHYPMINDPERVVGHEQISGFRGKVDPGVLFNWSRFYQDNYPDSPAPKRQPVCPKELLDSLSFLKNSEPRSVTAKNKFWASTSLMIEAAVRLVEEAKRDSGL